MKKIAVGLSGGVDSSVVLLLLKEQGFDVTGVQMQCWDYNEEGCTGEQDKADAVSICSQLEVPFKFLDFQKEYQEKVIQNFYDEYNAGRTPNPDILCNKEIKFGLFLNWALENGYDAIATGHYAKVQKTDLPRLFIPKDKSKDQTYFLYRLTSNQLEKILFPLGEMLKDEVKEIAFQNNLKNFNKPESMGICFIGKVNVRDFLKRRISEKPGNVLNLKGEVIGKHRGVPFYTIGQRHGFEVFKYAGIPLYVISKNAATNELVIGTDEEAAKQGRTNTGVLRAQRQSMVVTSSGVLFCTGKDGKVYAFDADNGKELWSYKLPTGTEGIPAMYELNGKHYLVVCASTPLRFGRNGEDNGAADAAPGSNSSERAKGSYIVFALPDKK